MARPASPTARIDARDRHTPCRILFHPRSSSDCRPWAGSGPERINRPLRHWQPRTVLVLGALAGVGRARRALAMAPTHLMPRKQSAGLLLFRRREGALEVLLVHPGGPVVGAKGRWRLVDSEGRGRDSGRRADGGAPRSRRRDRSAPLRPIHLALTSPSDRRKDRPRVGRRERLRPGVAHEQSLRDGVAAQVWKTDDRFPKSIAPAGSTSTPPRARSSRARRSSCNTFKRELQSS